MGKKEIPAKRGTKFLWALRPSGISYRFFFLAIKTTLGITIISNKNETRNAKISNTKKGKIEGKAHGYWEIIGIE